MIGENATQVTKQKNIQWATNSSRKQTKEKTKSINHNTQTTAQENTANGVSAFDWSMVGYHGAALVLRAGLLKHAAEPRGACIAFIKAHLATCFPNDVTAPRLSSPQARGLRFYTPYFATFSFQAMAEAGEMDWVNAQYRTAWGWALTQATTWLEVFDPRWEKVHSWSGCPTWQLSRFCLGLSPRLDVGARHFQLQLHCGTELMSAQGTVPCQEEDTVRVNWNRKVDGVHYQITVTAPIFVRGWNGSTSWLQLDGTASCVL